MSKPKILHFILDGFSPSNVDDPWNSFRGLLNEDIYTRKEFTSKNPDNVDRPHSPDMWTRAYSKVKFDDILTEDDFRISVSNKIQRVPSEKFIWNKLSKVGIPSWIYPYGQYYHSVDENMLNEDSSHVSGVIKMYSSNLSYKVDNGVAEWYRSPIGTYYGMHEIARPSNFKGTKYESYPDEWKKPTEEFLARIPGEIHEYLDTEFTKFLEANTKLFHEEILPHLNSHIEEFKDGGYIHVGLVETDVPMHFAIIYPDIMEKVHQYLLSVIKESVEIVNPDILIITGDHGMVRTEEAIRGRKLRKPVVQITHGDQTRVAVQAHFGVAPIYSEHSREFGAVFYSKDASLISEFEGTYFDKSDYLMFDIHDFIYDNLTK